MIKLTVDLMIEINRGMLEKWIEKHPDKFEGVGSDRDKLADILTEVEKQDNVIGKAAYLLARIAWDQPFSGGNKRTAVICADIVLRNEGFKLYIENKEDEEYLRKLLFEVQEERVEINPTTIAKLVLYVSKRITRI